MQIVAKIELGQMDGGHCVNVWLNDRLVDVFGPFADINEAEAAQAEKAAIVQKTLREQVKRLREPRLDPSWPEWSVSPGHCEHAEDHEVLERVRVCGWKTGLCAGPCPSCPNREG
jgi:hypothetical protein